MSGSHHDHGHDAPPASSPSELPPLRLVSNYTDGGHEIDATPDRNLFAFLGVMVVLLVVASIGVYQLFVVHTGGQLASVANIPAEQLEQARAHASEIATTWGKSVKDGVTTFRMPYSEAKKLVLSNPDAFRPAPPPPGWIHPDDAK
jgi:hypothetical protein